MPAGRFAAYALVIMGILVAVLGLFAGGSVELLIVGLVTVFAGGLLEILGARAR